MDVAVPLWSLITAILLILLLVGCVAACWNRDSPSIRRRRSTPEPPSTSTLDARIAQVLADQAELFSTLEKLTTTVKRLSSRQGMRDAREESRSSRDSNPPPVGAAKVDLLRYYGMAGKTGPNFAQAQLDLERRQHQEH